MVRIWAIAALLSAPAFAVITVKPSAIPNYATLNAPYSSGTLQEQGGQSGFYSWTISAGSLPPGLNYSNPPSSATNSITGTPTAAGSYQFTVRVTSIGDPDEGDFGERAYTITVPQITTASPLAPGTAGSAYSQQFVWDGPAGGTWSITGTIPPTLGMNQGTGILSGPLTQAGNYNFNVSVNANGTVASKGFSLTVNGGGPATPLTIVTTSLPAGVVNQSYSQTVQASGGTPPYTFSAQDLPPKVSIDSAGNVTGFPGVAGIYDVRVTVSDKDGAKVTKQISLTIHAASSTLSITTTTLPNGNTNAVYNQPIQVTGGTSPYSFSASGLPGGLIITSGGGLITGTPTAGGFFSVTVTVADSVGNQASQQYNLNIIPGLTILTTSLMNGSVGQSYFQQISAGGGTAPYSFTGSGTPDGLKVTSDGRVSGTPAVDGTFTVTVTVTDSVKAMASADLSLKIYTLPSFTTKSPLPAAIGGTMYSQTFAGTGGLAPYSFFLLTAPSTLPPGLALSQQGGLTGIPATPGDYTFTIQLIDTNKNAVTRSFQLTVNPANQPLIVSPGSIQFSASPGDVSGPQEITVTGNGGAAVGFTVQIDDGNGGPAPAWLKATPKGGTTPAVVMASLSPAPMLLGASKGRIRIMATGAQPIDISVTLNVSNPPAQLTVSPSLLRGRAHLSAPQSFDQSFVIRNLGGQDPIPLSFTVLNKSSWITAVTPTANMIRANGPVSVKVTLNSQGLKAGTYRDAIHITTPLPAPYDKFDVPVVLFVAPAGPIMNVFRTGVRIPARLGNPTSRVQQIPVFDVGDPGTAVNWTAQAIRGANLVTILNPNGVSTPGNPSSFGIRLTPAATATAGGSFAMIQVSDPQAQFAPQYVTVVADVAGAGTATSPDPEPPGVIFTGSAGGTAPASQQVTVNTTSADPVALGVSVSTDDGGSWLSAKSLSTTTSLASPAQVTISVNPGAMSPGFYTGLVNLAIGDAVRGVFVAFILKPNGNVTTAARPVKARDATSCTPSAIQIAQNGLPANFSVPASWPSTVSVFVSDDCGGMLTGASVGASFSNGDPPIALTGDYQSGSYSGTWAPSNPTSAMTITIDAASGSLTPGQMQVGGNVDPNAVQSPSLVIAGLLNNLNPQVGAPLAPGTVTQVYGDNLTTTPSSPSTVPLPTNYQGVEVIISGYSAPIYYISKTQLTIQVPAELSANGPNLAFLAAGNQYTVPQEVDLTAIAPGTVAFSDGRIVAQHQDYTLVDSTRPAKSGETLTLYLVGMGATNPPVASGTPAPSNPLAKVPSVVQVSVDGQSASVSFVGLTPGGVGLYQINFVVPAGLRNGTLDLLIQQDGVKANAATLIVSN